MIGMPSEVPRACLEGCGMGKWSYGAAAAREPEETGAIGAMRAAFEARGWEFGCLEFETSKGETRVEVELFDPDAPPGAIAEVYASVPKGSEADARAWRGAFSDKLERLLPRAASAAPAAAAQARRLAEGYGEAMAEAQAMMGLPPAEPVPRWAAAVCVPSFTLGDLSELEGLAGDVAAWKARVATIAAENALEAMRMAGLAPEGA